MAHSRPELRQISTPTGKAGGFTKCTGRMLLHGGYRMTYRRERNRRQGGSSCRYRKPKVEDDVMAKGGFGAMGFETFSV